jgi:hypothetical protein
MDGSALNTTDGKVVFTLSEFTIASNETLPPVGEVKVYNFDVALYDIETVTLKVFVDAEYVAPTMLLNDTDVCGEDGGEGGTDCKVGVLTLGATAKAATKKMIPTTAIIPRAPRLTG